jgi:murein DD-endopeptidase MepM/ murein hydrolase activator NlpD
MNNEKTRILAQLLAMRVITGLTISGPAPWWPEYPFSAWWRHSARPRTAQKSGSISASSSSSFRLHPAPSQAAVECVRARRAHTAWRYRCRAADPPGRAGRARLCLLRQQPETQALFRQLRPGKIVTARTSESGELLALTFPLNGSKDSALVVEKRDGRHSPTSAPWRLTPQVVMKSGEIRTSLFAATDAIGLPDSVATQMADIFGGDIDFHRDLRKGDRFSVVYEMLFSQGQPVRSGRILAAEFINNGKTFSASGSRAGTAKVITRPKAKTSARPFCARPLSFHASLPVFPTPFHPIHQTWRAHKGVDYGAPIGTRVKATGDGIVEFAGRQGGYGNLVVIRHQGRFTTHYGHLNGFAQGIRKGMRDQPRGDHWLCRQNRLGHRPSPALRVPHQ